MTLRVVLQISGIAFVGMILMLESKMKPMYIFKQSLQKSHFCPVETRARCVLVCIARERELTALKELCGRL